MIFCDNPFDPKTVDPDFQDEFTAAKESGFTTFIFSFDTLIKDKDVLTATRKINSNDLLEKIIYRGWMLKPFEYSLLYDSLIAKNYQLINSPIEYQNAHYLPDNYKFIKNFTPKTVWTNLDNKQPNYENIFKLIEDFKDSPLILKDYVKSQKHYWDTACFIPTAKDKDKVKSVVNKFIQLQGNDLNQGLVFRQFIELNHLTIHSKSGMPLKEEYRLFFLKGKLLGCYEYWEEGDYAPKEKPPLGTFIDIAKNIRSNFFSMDIARTKQGNWIIIELGDGQVAGLPEKVNKNEFYEALLQQNGS